MLADLSLVATNESYYSKLTGRTKAKVLSDKVISPKNLRGTPGMRQHGTHFYVVNKSLSSLFGAEMFWLPILRLVNPTLQTRQNMRLLKRRLLEIHLSVRS